MPEYRLHMLAVSNNWGSVWDFGTNTQLPGLVIDGVIYRDDDVDGVLD